MYDWNALWHTHAGKQQRFASETLDINQLAPELGASLHRAARNPHDIAVYDHGDHYSLLRHDQGLQLLRLEKRVLFDIAIRLVTADEGQPLALPYLEVLVDNLATGEAGNWRAEVHCNEDGELLANDVLLQHEQPPAMDWPELSFADDARFATALRDSWQEAAEAVTLDAAAWFNAEALEQHATEPPLDARIQQMCERYAEIVRREQALLSRQFSDEELLLIAEVLRGVTFESAESCRGLWLAVENRLLQDELDRKHGVDGAALLRQLQQLSYTQEVALIEALAPAQD